MTEVEVIPTGGSTNRGVRWKWPLVAISTALLAGSLAIVGLSQRSSTCSPDVSVARLWNEAVLAAIRRDFPAPTVHSRNLFHLSAATWDVWAAYDPNATGVFVNDAQAADDVNAARIEAISFASHRLLSARYANSVGSEESLREFDSVMDGLCFDVAATPVANSQAAFGLHVANEILASTLDDGSLEAEGYLDTTYMPVNLPLEVDEPGTTMVDPNRWQPLSLTEQTTQNGQRIPAGVQEFIGSNWGFVTPFSLEPDPIDGLPYNPGPPPLAGSEATKFADAASEVVGYSSTLDPSSSASIDISPTVIGNTRLGGYSPDGWDENPVTGTAYEPNVVLEADFGRVIAEYWADGPDSETPPGHWNSLSNEVGDELEQLGRLQIDGRPVQRLEYDVKVGLALNGALHDSAIAAWGAKAYYDYARPISMIRYLGQRDELSEIPEVVETITEASSAEGERHAHLAGYVGEQAVFSWRGEPFSPSSMTGGVAWMRAANWVPYQRASFVTPSFAGYVSGHSAFSRAAAEVLTELTGSEFFPGGLQTHRVEPGGLIHERGPTTTVVLQWATYRDAADQAGLSRLYGGIHVRSDDLAGRQMGADIGQLAAAQARTLFNGE